MLTKDPATLEQLPRSAADYYRDSVRSDIFTYHLVGTDSVGRRVYQKYFDSEPYGRPRALLKPAEYTRKVKEWAKICSSIGIERWTEPYYSEVQDVPRQSSVHASRHEAVVA